MPGHIPAIIAFTASLAFLSPGLLAADLPAHRAGTIVIESAPRETVHVRQLRHAFRFGTCLATQAFTPRKAWPEEDTKRYKETILSNFNAVVAENAMKWKSMKKNQGEPDYRVADAMAAWAAENGLALRGHCVFWEVEKHVPDWVKPLPEDALRSALRERAATFVTRYRDSIREWDVNNEMLHGSWFSDRLGRDIWPDMFEWCREADPDARLFVNDFKILWGGDLEDYVKQIKWLLRNDAPVGGIGVQGHFFDAPDKREIEDALDKLARFDLPIVITEFSYEGKDEEDQAEGLETAMVTAFEHPAVDAFFLWGFWDKAHWRPKAGLYRADWSPKPAADTFHRLVFEDWWTDREIETDRFGRASLEAAAGDYEIIFPNRPPRRISLAAGESVTVEPGGSV